MLDILSTVANERSAVANNLDVNVVMKYVMAHPSEGVKYRTIFRALKATVVEAKISSS